MACPQIIDHENAAEMAQSLANEISGVLRTALSQDGQTSLLLPGGSSPQLLITKLAQTDVPWNRVTISTTDERCVPIAHEASNAGKIINLFAEQGVEISPLHLLDTKIEEKLSALSLPFDVVVLGMGLDGHYASLFPDFQEPETAAYIVHTTASFEPTERVSLTTKALLNTKRLILLVPGQEKWNLCQKVLDGEGTDLPIANLFGLAQDSLEIHKTP